jgi:hypothetical protein
MKLVPEESRWLRRLLRPLWVVLAVFFLFEGWLWDRLSALGVRIAHVIALPAWRARLAAVIERLPPVATLAVFLVPVLLLLPVKLLGLWMLARGSWLGAVAVLGLAKVVSMGTTAFLFQVTKPKLLQLAWFRFLYDRVMAVLAWAHRQTDPIKARVRAFAHALTLRLLARRPNSKWLRRILRIRRRAQRA